MEEQGEGVMNNLEEQNELKQRELELEQKKALIAEAKKRYGRDWSKYFSNVHSGIDWQALKFKLNSQ
jgi:hypothetical protein